MSKRLQSRHQKLKPSTRVKVAQPAKRADPFYLSPEWRALMDRLIAERGRRCQDPECNTPNRVPSRIFGDHIIERRDGGADLDPSNVLLRCGSCHTRKTAQARAQRVAFRPQG